MKKGMGTGKPRIKTGLSDEHKIEAVAGHLRGDYSQGEGARRDGITGPSFSAWVKRFKKEAERLNAKQRPAANGHAEPSRERAPQSVPAPSVTSLGPALAALEAYIAGLVDARVKERMSKMWNE